MPNWVFNKITVKGRVQTLQRLATLLKSDESVFDFNKVIPCPEELMKDDWQNDKAKAAENVRNYGYEGWYDWRVAKWGTKWNTDSSARVVSGGMHATLIYDFDTAWSPPTELVEEIARRFPSLTIQHEYHEEAGMYPSCIRTYKGGEVSEEEIENINLIDEND